MAESGGFGDPGEQGFSPESPGVGFGDPGEQGYSPPGQVPGGGGGMIDFGSGQIGSPMRGFNFTDSMPPSSFSSGFLQALQQAGPVSPSLLATLAAALGGGAAGAARGRGISVSPPDAPLGAFGGGEDQRGGEPFRAPTSVQQAIAQALSQGGRGQIGTMPEFLRPELLGLSPFQQRAAIGTYGTSSESGRYRAPETIDYYKTLVENTLKNEMGVPIGSPLPIEWQYLREVLGVSPPETTDAFLSAVANYQAPI